MIHTQDSGASISGEDEWQLQIKKANPMMESLLRPRSRVVYVCHAFAGDCRRNRERLLGICRNITEQGHTPLAPQLVLPEYIDEDTERELALKHYLQLLELVDEVWVYGQPTAGMEQEITAARETGISVRMLL